MTMARGKSSWDHLDDRNALIVQLWNEGERSSSQVVALMRQHGYELTRNTIIGVINRKVKSGGAMRTKNPPHSIHPSESGRKIKQVKARCKPMAMPAPLPDAPKPIGPIEDIPISGCQYLDGDVSKGGWRMCGHPAHKPGSPWCTYHYRRMNQPGSRQVNIDYKPRKRNW
jgi:hypothetical protein